MTEPAQPDKSNQPTPPRDVAGFEQLVAQATANADRRRAKRRYKLPLLLFILTVFSTFWVGITDWEPMLPFTQWANNPDPFFMDFRCLLLENWQQGMLYSFCLLLILLLHEFGHYFATLIYRVPATLPIFLPFPVNPIGTLGAVIGMNGMLANRKQIFDIGIAGPLAGLVAAIPLAYWGVSELDLTSAPQGGLGFRLPLIMKWMAESANVPGYTEPTVWLNQLNPVFAAAWVGLLITGLNMVPVGQLDGGHITYTLFGKHAHWIAETIIVLAVAFMVYYQHFIFVVMVLLVLFLGTRHPPTADDSVKLGAFRWILGLVSLLIPFLCFPPMIFKIVY